MWKWQAEGQAKAVIVLVHSAYEHHLRYGWQIEQWRAAGFQVVMGDLAGHGKSRATSKPHMADFTVYETEIDEMLKAAYTDGLPVFVIAHGFGAILVMSYLSRVKQNIAGVVFTSPWLKLIKTPSKISGALPGLHKLTPNMKINHGLMTEDLTRNPEIIEMEWGDELYRPVVTVKWYHELQTYMKILNSGKVKFPDIPTFVHTAENDLVSDKEAAKNWLKQQDLKEFSYKEWKGAYHDLFQEPERENVLVTTHLFMKNVLRTLGYVVK
ncbi:alpha/beta fold hydrolase [Planococcus sp. CAU13]|uniref:alpha/beta fold hydrolase n=1 Tax=Planococcus sp. CAU13 TaxID=1541197 RepID=UPI00052FF4C5|nr:alpha/beta hydrolase [Planococcus sp. CAU13]